MPFKIAKNGFPVCSILENQIRAVSDFVTAQLRSLPSVMALRAAADYLTETDLNSQQIVFDPKAENARRDISKIFKQKLSYYEK